MYKINDFGIKLKILREYRKIKSQRQAALLINRHHQQWYLWESGQAVPTAPQIVEICNALKISIEYFYKEGLPANFDFSGNTISVNLIPFAETTVSKSLFIMIKEAQLEKSITLVSVPSGVGSSRAVNEYAALEPDVLVFNGKTKGENATRSGLALAILDHAEFMEEEEIKAFIKQIKSLSDGIVIISHRKLDTIYFTKEYRLRYLSIKDLIKITDNALPELKELLDAHNLAPLKNQILAVLASEVIDNINKIERLKAKFQEKVIPNFSLENIAQKLVLM